ncbi:hypothetical protein GEMRC1_002727 [Eukaryota sp. GEM-RC1]
MSYSKVDSTEMKDVVLEFKEDPEPRSPCITKVKNNWSLIGIKSSIIIGLFCFIIGFLTLLLFFFLRSSTPPTFLVSGLITSDSVPLPGVIVFGEGINGVYSDDDGLFLFELKNGEYGLNFQLCGYDPKSVMVTVSNSDKFIDVSLLLNTFIVTGVVTGHSVPLSGVRVSGDDLDDVYSDDDGLFEIEPLTNGEYELSFELSGYDPKSVIVTVSDSDKFVDVSLLLNTFNVTGVVTGDSVPLSGVRVSGDDLDDVYSDDDGLFEIEPLTNGEYELNFELSGYDPKSVIVTVSDSDKFVDVSLLLNTFNVTGVVTGDSVPLSGVRVSGDDLNDVYSDDDGLFEIEPLTNGEYELNFELSGYDPKSVIVTVSDSDKFVDVFLSLTPTFNVSGVVTSDAVPLSGVIVSCDYFDDVHSDDDGLFKLQPLVNGYGSKSISVEVSDSNQYIEVSLELLLTLELTVYDDVTSDPIPNPRATLVNQNLIVDGNEHGYIELVDLIAGDYDLFITHSNYYNRAITVQLNSSESKSVSMTRHGYTIVDNIITDYDAFFWYKRHHSFQY